MGDDSVGHKLVSNCFGFCPTHSGGAKEGYLLGLATSLFNHSATPNCKHTAEAKLDATLRALETESKQAGAGGAGPSGGVKGEGRG